MSRASRLVVAGQPHHVIIRGNNREPIFIAEEDYRFYLEKLNDACVKHQCDLHTYVLMTNHVHLLITPHKDESLAKVMQMVGRYYVQYFNYSYRRTGTLWEGRYKSTLIDSDAYALICYRYIELNPVRAGMVDEPAQYPWSSYRANALGERNDMLIAHELYVGLAETSEHRLVQYRALFENYISLTQIENIRDATNKSWVLGNDHFRHKIEQQLGRRLSPAAKGGDRKSVRYQEQSKINRVRPL
ncbi:MAG: transposase [Pseudomonadota bacterium]|nr:transposase [Pseudomonadota bacterium]